MTESVFKIKVSDILVGRDTVRVGAFVAPAPDQTFQRCGELTLTQEEGKVLKNLVEDVEYEYACVRYIKGTDELNNTPILWEAKKGASDEVKLMGGGKSRYWDYVLVKRRKAGPMERV